MGYKFYKLDEYGELVPSTITAYREGLGVRYELSKHDNYLSREFVCGEARININDRVAYLGFYEVTWNVLVMDKIGYVRISFGQFEKLNEAQKYAVKIALDFAKTYPRYGAHKLFDNEEVRIDMLPVRFTQGSDEPEAIRIPFIEVDKKAIEENKERAKRRLLEKEARLNGKEDTRIMVKVLLNINLNDLNEALANHLQNEVSVIDGVGADGDSTYNVDEVGVKVESTGAIEATFYLERESGKFASADDLREEIINQIGANSTVEIPLELVE